MYVNILSQTDLSFTLLNSRTTWWKLGELFWIYPRIPLLPWCVMEMVTTIASTLKDLGAALQKG